MIFFLIVSQIFKSPVNRTLTATLNANTFSKWKLEPLFFSLKFLDFLC